MKTIMKTMMVIGMMILGTVTTMGKTNTTVHNNYNKVTVVKKECNLRHIHDRNCNKVVVVNKHTPMMDKKLTDHIMKGNHNFDRHGVCKKCNMTRTEIRRIEDSMMHNDCTRNHGTTRPVPYRGR